MTQGQGVGSQQRPAPCPTENRKKTQAVQYRRELDGLRAIAVIPVVLLHAGFKLCSGGFVGVDVFFVISGYLITSIIIEEKQNNS